jgi:hypothetical protein
VLTDRRDPAVGSSAGRRRSGEMGGARVPQVVRRDPLSMSAFRAARRTVLSDDLRRDRRLMIVHADVSATDWIVRGKAHGWPG